MIKQGSNVKLHYTLTVAGETVDSSRDREPHTYVHGQGQIVPGLEEQLEGKQAGETVTATVGPEKAYGAYRPEAVQRVAKSAFGDADKLQPGMRVAGQAGDQPFEATVTQVGDEEVALDLNHPMAGKTLEFEVEILEVS